MLDFLKQEQCGKILLLPIEEIEPNPTQPRRTINLDELESLAQSIEENGLISPITVRRVGRCYQLITGQRRMAAFTKLGRDKIPAIVEDLDDEKAPIHSLVENVQRSQLTYVDEALAIGSILVSQNLTQVAIAKKLGMSQSAVANKLRLLKFKPEQLEKMIMAGLTERHARAMLPLIDNPILEDLINKVIKRGLNVSQTEAFVADTIKGPPRKQNIKIKIKDMRIFFTTINKAVDIMIKAGINATTEKAESNDTIVYTITIPKSH